MISHDLQKVKLFLFT